MVIWLISPQSVWLISISGRSNGLPGRCEKQSFFQNEAVFNAAKRIMRLTPMYFPSRMIFLTVEQRFHQRHYLDAARQPRIYRNELARCKNAVARR